MANAAATAEGQRLAEDAARTKYWKKWGPYVSHRQWGTVREDYSPNGTAWDYISGDSHNDARFLAYRWGEDGIAGISDNHQRLCFAPAFWNGKDPIVKERLFGLTNSRGNHGEDVKEYYFHLDNTPTHSYMQYVYKYPQAAFPYASLVNTNAARGAGDFEFELMDTGVFNENRYFDILITYAKADTEDILIQIDITNRGPDAASLFVLPTLWFRNTWSWFNDADHPVPVLSLDPTATAPVGIHAHMDDPTFPDHWLYAQGGQALFTNNVTNRAHFGWPVTEGNFSKDTLGTFLVQHGAPGGGNPANTGTKAVVHLPVNVAAGATQTVRLRLTSAVSADPFGASFDATMTQRKQDADAFYAAVIDNTLTADQQAIERQAYAGMLWCKQFYYYVVEEWLDGDPAGPPPPSQRLNGRNADWRHLYNADILSMPDDWEYPWYATWDLAFHTVVLSRVDVAFAKSQLDKITREWYMSPDGQVPAYEWSFSDVNPPVQAWAALEIYRYEKTTTGTADVDFLKTVFQKLVINFTWWANKKDADGTNVFGGGFLGMDNIGPFNRSNLPDNIGGHLDQADGTSWMAFYALSMLDISLELANTDATYLDMAMKFFQHFLLISRALNEVGGEAIDLWDNTDGFFYDILDRSDFNQPPVQMKVRSMVGLIPLIAVRVFTSKFWTDPRFEEFSGRLKWFLQHRPDLTHHQNINIAPPQGANQPWLLSVVNPDKLKRILKLVLDPNEFLSPFGIRSVSKFHAAHPFSVDLAGTTYTVAYAPKEASDSRSTNSNWRGPIWMPINFLLVEALETYHQFLGDQFTVEYPSGSGNQKNLHDIAQDLGKRLVSIFTSQNGQRPVYGGNQTFQTDPNWRNFVLFYEYFQGDNGAGLGASHQTGWTGLINILIDKYGK